MTEEEYCKANDLGSVTAALSVLRGIVPECGHNNVNKEEYQEVMRLTVGWQAKLFESVETSD
tara:strand:- start:7789 stop:7974 length:186 start_codon:yes stop_codon:yes gene_type:complete